MNEQKFAELAQYVRNNPTHGRYRVAEAMGISRAASGRALDKLRGKGGKTAAATAIPSVGHTYDETANTAESVSVNPITLDELLKVCKVDLKVWRVERFVVNKWSVGTKNGDGTVRVTPLYQVKAYLERIPGAEDRQLIKDTIEWVKTSGCVPRLPSPSHRKTMSVADPVMLEISIPDLHLGKMAWADETGENYDTAIAESRYISATRELWNKASVWPVEKILLPVGSDFWNVDNSRNETTAGTPQSEDSRWPKTFKRGIALIRHQIEMLRGKCPGGIDVVVIRGNHDSERAFMAGCVLQAMYEHCKDVRITNEPKKRQYVQWGTVMLGLMHGDGAKHDKLPLIMAGEAPAMWSSSTHREIHLGHLHHKKETQFHVGTEHGAVRVRILPSLTATDAWHYDNGYVGAKQAAEAYLWGKKAGYIGHLSWSPVS